MYRDAPLTGAACYKHASAPMAAQCESCERALCDPCIVYEVSSPHCIDCAKKARRRRSLVAAAKIAGGLALLAGGVVFVATRPSASISTFVESSDLMRLHNKVRAERCDKRATLEYEDALIAADEPREALRDSDAYFGKCGEWYRLRWVRYSAHEHLSEHDAAAAEASKLMEHDPADHDYPWWRGMAYEEMGRLDEAMRDYRRALEIEPALDRIPFNLSSLLEQKGKFCEARQPIQQFVKYHPAFADAPNVVDRLERLRILGHCDGVINVRDVPRMTTDDGVKTR
jgi:tetratricopeptide (TPR) repeat protein